MYVNTLLLRVKRKYGWKGKERKGKETYARARIGKRQEAKETYARARIGKRQR
jgi:hypothetical protein